MKFKEAVRPASGDKDFHHEIDDKEHTIKIKEIDNSFSSSQMKNSAVSRFTILVTSEITWT